MEKADLSVQRPLSDEIKKNDSFLKNNMLEL